MTPAPDTASDTAPVPSAHHHRASGRATRAAILEAATPLFAEHGFNGASVRTIAAAAQVDPALVIRHFGSKEALFLQTIDPGGGFIEVIEGPLETLGRRMVEHFLGKAGSHLRQNYVALMRASDLPSVRQELSDSSTRSFVQPISARLSGEHRELRAALVAAQIGGLLNALFLAEDPVLAGAADADIVEIYGSAIQLVLDSEG